MLTATRQRALLLVSALALGLTAANSALAQQGESTSGYLTDQRNGIVKDPYNLCWRTGYWTPALAHCECDVDLIPRDICFPPPPKPAAAPRRRLQRPSRLRPRRSPSPRKSRSRPTCCSTSTKRC